MLLTALDDTLPISYIIEYAYLTNAVNIIYHNPRLYININNNNWTDIIN